MHSFVVVAAKPGRGIPVHVSDIWSGRMCRNLRLYPTITCIGRGRGNRGLRWVAVVERRVEIGSHWHLSDLGLTAFSGRPWPRAPSSGTSWARVGVPLAGRVYGVLHRSSSEGSSRRRAVPGRARLGGDRPAVGGHLLPVGDRRLRSTSRRHRPRRPGLPTEPAPSPTGMLCAPPGSVPRLGRR